MTGSITRNLAWSFTVATVLVSLIPAVAMAGFISSALNTRVENGYRYVSITGPQVTEGISHRLNPDDWFMFRVRIRHEDSQFPMVGYTSDNFAPTDDDIQICNEPGCEAPAIDAGVEAVDWSDSSKVTVLLEAKSCMLCEWEAFECEIE